MAYAPCCFLSSNNFHKKEENIILLFRNKRNHVNMFYGGGWYSTMDSTLMIHFPPFIRIIGISVLLRFNNGNTV